MSQIINPLCISQAESSSKTPTQQKLTLGRFPPSSWIPSRGFLQKFRHQSSNSRSGLTSTPLKTHPTIPHFKPSLKYATRGGRLLWLFLSSGASSGYTMGVHPQSHLLGAQSHNLQVRMRPHCALSSSGWPAHILYPSTSASPSFLIRSLSLSTRSLHLPSMIAFSTLSYLHPLFTPFPFPGVTSALH